MTFGNGAGCAPPPTSCGCCNMQSNAEWLSSIDYRKALCIMVRIDICIVSRERAKTYDFWVAQSESRVGGS